MAAATGATNSIVVTALDFDYGTGGGFKPILKDVNFSLPTGALRTHENDIPAAPGESGFQQGALAVSSYPNGLSYDGRYSQFLLTVLGGRMLLVGDNGAGKSTLLRVLAGEISWPTIACGQCWGEACSCGVMSSLLRRWRYSHHLQPREGGCQPCGFVVRFLRNI